MNPMPTSHPSIQTAQTGGAQPQPQAGYPPGQVRNPRNQQQRFAQPMPPYQQVQPIYVAASHQIPVGYTAYQTAGVPPQHTISVAPTQPLGAYSYQPYHHYAAYNPVSTFLSRKISHFHR